MKAAFGVGPHLTEPTVVTLASPADDDGVTVLTRAYGGSVLVLGGAHNHVFQLADARTLANTGRVWCVCICNASSQIIGIEPNGGGPYVARVPPRGSAELVLVGDGTAAGSWIGGLSNDGSCCNGNLVLAGNFATHATSTTVNESGYHIASGAGALSRSIDWNDRVQAAAMGFTNAWWYGYCGTDAGGDAACRWGHTSLGYGFDLQDGPYAYECTFSLEALPTAAEDFIVSLGAAGTTEFCRMILDRTMVVAADYYLHAETGGVPALVDTGVVAVAATPTQMRIERARGADRIDLWIDRVHVATTSGGPAGADALSFGPVITGVATAGGTTRGLCLGFQKMTQAPVTPLV